MLEFIIPGTGLLSLMEISRRVGTAEVLSASWRMLCSPRHQFKFIVPGTGLLSLMEVPSALKCLTTLFGMGRGVATSLEAPETINLNLKTKLVTG